MGVFDDDEIRCSPADCLLSAFAASSASHTPMAVARIHAHTLAYSYIHTYTVRHMHKATPFLIVEELLAL